MATGYCCAVIGSDGFVTVKIEKPSQCGTHIMPQKCSCRSNRAKKCQVWRRRLDWGEMLTLKSQSGASEQFECVVYERLRAGAMQTRETTESYDDDHQ